MSKNETSKVTEVSKSKQKRLEQKNKAANQRKSEKRNRLVAILIVALMLLIVAGIVCVPYIKKAQWVKPVADASEFSSMLDANGFIEGVKASDLVDMPDINSISVDYSEIECTDETIDSNIDSILASNQVISDDASKEVANSDKVNIDYEGKIDGEAFDGGSYEGYDLTIGSGSFIEGFEDQLIGAKKGDVVEVKVTFSEDYSSADVAGKDAVFTVTINGIYETPEFTDEFVKSNLSEYADTVEGYREYYKASVEKSNLKSYLETYLEDNTTAKSYPNGYVKLLQKQKRFTDELDYENMNLYTQMYMGYSMYSDFASYIGEDENAYVKSSKESAMNTAKNNLLYQAILEKEGVTLSIDDLNSYIDAKGSEAEVSYTAEYGDPYNVQRYIKVKALELVSDKVTVNK